MIKISKLTNKDITKFSKFTKEIVGNNKYYTSFARSEEVKNLDPNKIRRKLKDKDRIYLIAKNNSNIIGFCYGNFDAGTFWIDYIGISRDFRRSSIASKILNYLEIFAKKANAHKIWCDTRIINKEAISLFKKLGFKKIGVLKKHWYGEDFIFWEKLIK